MTVDSGFGSPAWAQAIASEQRQLDDDIQRARQHQQALAASNDKITAVPARFRHAVTQARQRLDRAEAAVTLAEQQVNLRIRMDRPDPELERHWKKEAMLRPNNEVQAAAQALAEAELALGRQVEARRAYDQARAAAPGQHAAIDRQAQEQHQAIDTALMGLQMKCALE